MNLGGIIGGALAGAASGAGDALAETGKLQQQQQSAMDLEKAKMALQTQHDQALLAVKQQGDMALEGVRQTGENQRTDKSIQGRHEDVATEQTGANTRQQLSETGANTRSAAEQRTRKDVAGMEISAAEKRQTSQQQFEMDHAGVGQRFTGADGTVYEKGGDGDWSTISNPDTGDAIKAMSPVQQAQLTSLQQLRNNLVEKLQQVDANIGVPKATRDQQKKGYNDQLNQIDRQLTGLLGGAQPASGSTSGTVAPQPAGQYSALWMKGGGGK